MYAATRGPNEKWGGTDFKWGTDTTGPPAGDGPGPRATLSYDDSILTKSLRNCVEA